ncbi:R3H domain-containing protein 4-like [Brevipalpus obovatus]|uniref:R3H domain-containing protein 4-like n=1 Tax=Brevipalpus obovatus TaxID=246614 RepID=UPI003D9F9C23
MGVIRKFTYSTCENDESFNPLEGITNDDLNEDTHFNNTNPIYARQMDANVIESDRAVAEELQDRELARQARNRTKKYREQLKKTVVRPEPAFRGLGCRGKSYKKYRRYENANLSGNFIGVDSDDYLNEISIYDFVPYTESAFTQLLNERENMKIWNDFINMSEEAQELFLDEIDHQEDDKIFSRKKKDIGEKSSSSISENDENNLNSNNDYKRQSRDKRAQHPAFTAQQCFSRIDNYLKGLLKKKHIPMTLLESIEKEVIDFFSAAPVSTYKSCLPSGFERLLLHALCQYLDLKCQSYDSNDGSRWSRVQNPKHTFIPPLINLTGYLATYCQRRK